MCCGSLIEMFYHRHKSRVPLPKRIQTGPAYISPEMRQCILFLDRLVGQLEILIESELQSAFHLNTLHLILLIKSLFWEVGSCVCSPGLRMVVASKDILTMCSPSSLWKGSKGCTWERDPQRGSRVAGSYLSFEEVLRSQCWCHTQTHMLKSFSPA